MALHALWDFGTIGGDVAGVFQFLPFLNAFLALGLGIAFVLRERGTWIAPVGWDWEEEAEGSPETTATSGPAAAGETPPWDSKADIS